MTDPDDKKSLYQGLRDFFGQKAEEVDEEEQDDESAEDDADQKQPEDGEETVTEDLITALAEDQDVEAEELREAVAAVKADDEESEEPEDEEEGAVDDAEGKTEDSDAGGADDSAPQIDVGEKLDEHLQNYDFVTEDQINQKMEDLRSDIVEDVGEKLAETNEEAVQEIAQKMSGSETPNPASGSLQDEQDFESHIEEVTSGEGW